MAAPSGGQIGNLFQLNTIYGEPIKNTKVVGRVVAQWLESDPNVELETAHCIGFSLGGNFFLISLKFK